MSKIILLFSVLILCATGCGGDSEGLSDSPPASGESESQAYGTDLTGLVSRFSQASAFVWHTCDDTDQPLRLEIAAVLDARREEIAAYTAAHSDGSTGYRRQSYGPLTIRTPLEAPHPRNQWSENAQRRWSEIYGDYRRIQNLPINSAWVRFNALVRDTITDDEQRLIFRRNMDIRRVDIPLLLRLNSALVSCQRRGDCAHPDLDQDLLDFVVSNPEYNRRHLLLNEPGTFAAQRNTMMSWASWVDEDAADHRFSPHMSARRVSRRVLELHLDPGPLAAAADVIKEAIESKWHTTGFQVEVVWHPEHSSDVELHPYLLEFSPELGTRAYVVHSRQVMRIYDDVRITTFAHEVGHILGFPDRYYTRFHRAQCRYYVESNDGDLMSSSTTGHVTAEDFRVLKDDYPLD